MVDLTSAPDLLRTADGRPLKSALAAAQRKAKWRAFFLVLPLLAFVVLTFIVPILKMLERSVNHDGFSANAPAMVAWFNANPASGDIPEEAYAALVTDLKQMQKDKTAGAAGTRINYTVPGTISVFKSAARAAEKMTPPYKDALIASNKMWADPLVWVAMRNASSAYTSDFYMVSADMQRDANGDMVRVEENQRIYVYLFLKTFALSIVITVACLLLAFPIAHLLAVLPMAKSNLLMILVLLPFWTSLLVRTSSWIAILQEQGIINDLMVWIGAFSEDGRIRMIYNQTGTIIVMTHILLPFMVLPLYSVMRVIPPSYARAARSLGATSWTTFRRIYLPQTLPGIAAGSLLVFILAVGYYITPALVGGADGQLISNLISFHMNKANWSMAAALAAILLAAVLILYWLYDRLIGIDRLKLG
ncbi:ABC transporter permease [Cypionkella sinensis]|uniref:ABC transporter permease n=1 Tax=Cypionkella sinensis TaxID=1756043 RepID=A0ABV7J1Z1_9RHOB